MNRNITNGAFELQYRPEDEVSNDYKFQRVMGAYTTDSLRKQFSKIHTSYYIQNIRSGSFSEISEQYMIDSQHKQTGQEVFTTDSFHTEMVLLKTGFQSKLQQTISFFQGIYTGMALLFTITLTLSDQVSQGLVRVEDQTLRIVSLLSAFGSFYSLIVATNKCTNDFIEDDFAKISSTANEIEISYKRLALSIFQFIFYLISYVLYNVSHSSAVKYNIKQQEYTVLTQITIAYTGLALVGWIITSVNTYKHQN